MRVRIVRVGGSLLMWDQLVPSLQGWLEAQPIARNVLIAGGGPWVDLLRQASHRYEIGDRDAHLLSIQAMSLTAKLLSRLIDCPLGKTIGDLQQPTTCALTVLDAHDFLIGEDARAADPLPQSWSVTSDSIAARAARAMNADELTLLKSCDCPIPNSSDRMELSRQGFVDEYFPVASRDIAQVAYVNLRRFAPHNDASD